MLVSKSRAAADFLRGKAQELMDVRGEGRTQALADLGSIQLLLGQADGAVQSLEEAVRLEGRGEGGGVCGHAGLLERARRQLEADGLRWGGGKANVSVAAAVGGKRLREGATRGEEGVAHDEVGGHC